MEYANEYKGEDLIAPIDSTEQVNEESNDNDKFIDTPVEDKHQDSHETNEDEEEQEDRPKRKDRPWDKKRINQIQKEKYRALHENENLRAEVERLRQFNEQSNNAAMTHYDASIQMKIQHAQNKLSEAIASGDVAEHTAAISELARNTAQLENINAWKSQQYAQEQTRQSARQPETYNNNQNQNQYIDLNDEAHNWLSENSWYDSNNSDYDSELAPQVQSYINSLDSTLIRNGQQSKIMNKDYFNKINKYVNFLTNQDEEDYQEPRQSRELIMKSSSNYVEPVGRSSNQAKAKSVQHKLSQEEKTWAKTLKISETDYIKYKIEDAKRQQAKGQGRI